MSPLEYRCEVCGAKAGEKCVNTLNPNKKLPGRRFHLGRAEPSVVVVDSDDEKWRDIPGYEGLYKVSDQGRVRSLDHVARLSDGRSQLKRGREIQARPDAYGYRRVGLYNEKKVVDHKVHQLVLEAFVGPRPEGMVSRHLNGDPMDARLQNLVYGTQSENMSDRRRHGTDHNARKTHCPRGHEYTEANVYRDRRGRRFCIACNTEKTRERRAQAKASAAGSGEHLARVAPPGRSKAAKEKR